MSEPLVRTTRAPERWADNQRPPVNARRQGPNGIVSADGHKLVVYDTDTCLLFDRRKDPFEMRNVYGAAAYAAVQRELRRRLERWRRDLNDPLHLP